MNKKIECNKVSVLDSLTQTTKINVSSCFSNIPKIREYVLPCLLPGTVGSIISPGGQGKSILALQLALFVASGIDLLNFGTMPTGYVVYLSTEDNSDIIHERLYHLGSVATETQKDKGAKNMSIYDLTQMEPPDLLKGKYSKLWREFIEKHAKESRLLILDTLRSFHSGDENNSAEMSLLMGYIRSIAARTSCAIVFLHHSNKALAIGGQGEMQQASRGSSVLTDNIRWQAYLSGMNKEEAKIYGVDEAMKSHFVRFGISKQNYAIPFNEYWLKRQEGGLLKPVQFMRASKKVEPKVKSIILEHSPYGDNW